MTYQFDLSELEFRLLRDFLHERAGIYFPDEKRSFVRMKLYPRAAGLGMRSFREYFTHLQFDDPGGREVSRMISLLVNNETYFFRELPQLTAFRDQVLPNLRGEKLHRNDKKIRIVSAGCSTGEEVYTLSILTFETGSFFWGWNVDIVGIDIDRQALEVARKGTYYLRSFRASDPKYLKRFFSENSGDFVAKDLIRRPTRFLSGNIFDPACWRELPDIDILFCRNVLIYFSPQKAREAILFFARALRPGGYLFLGHSEAFNELDNEFEALRFQGTIVHRKRAE